MKAKSRYLLFGLVLALLEDSPMIDAQPGFINLDCGLATGLNTKNEMGYVYISDASYIDSGESKPVSANTTDNNTMFNTVRSFPKYQRNCYDLKPVSTDTRYLVRASFMYGNYDGLNQLPRFDVYLGDDFWSTLKFDNASHIVWIEIIGKTNSSSMAVCLINTNGGTPFISILELRPLPQDVYKGVNNTEALITYMRMDTGSVQPKRFEDDPFDRIWTPDYNKYGVTRGTDKTIQTTEGFVLPQSVLKTGAVSTSPIVINWPGMLGVGFHFFFYFAEVQIFPVNQSRILTISLNGEQIKNGTILEYLRLTVFTSLSPLMLGTYNFSVFVTPQSRLGPIINGFEIYKTFNVSGCATLSQDADAIRAIKACYLLTRNWGGDPCLPEKIPWDGLNCGYETASTPRITSLDLSNSGLAGTITDSFSHLTALSFLNLSGNSLSGTIPDFFATMVALSTLDLSRNQLTGKIPKALQDRANRGNLTLRTEGNSLSSGAFSYKMKNSVVWTLITIWLTVAIF